MYNKEKKWMIKAYNEDVDFHLSVDSKIRKFLWMIGLSDEEEMEEFFSLSPRKTYDPFLLKNMDKVILKIKQTIAEDKKICIYGDYDVDGVTSVSLLYEVLSLLTDKIDYYIPSRFEEGYGLNKEALQNIKNKGTDLVITVDCGSTSVAEVDYAKEIGLDIVVTDHHHVGEKLPECLILNPKQHDCTYPFKDICGCGVAFKLAQGLQRKANLPKQILLDVLDLLAIGTVSDIVPLLDENRTFVKYGLKEINKKKRKGLAALIEGIGLGEKKIKSYHISFIIGPHINAAGRINHALTGVELLLSDNEKEIDDKTALLIESNRERRNIQKDAFDQCYEIAVKNHPEDLFLVIESPNTHEGVAGIVASKIKEAFYRPTIIVTRSDGAKVFKGTGRSIVDINLFQYMNQYKENYIKFGGHSGACGFSIYEQDIHLLRENLNKDMQRIKEKNSDCFVPKAEISLELEVSDINFEFVEIIEKLEPFGHKNERPLFLIKNLWIEKKYLMGKDKDHVKVVLKNKNGYTIECVGFYLKNRFDSFSPDENLSIIGIPEINEYKGLKKICFQIEDIKRTSEI
ncbi:MAG: single-stranded-DNA-specific exonuclease RecJ [Peptostreptococcales bacterium]